MTNFCEGFKCKVGIEVYDKFGEGYWAQSRYLVHGVQDVLWTNDIYEAFSFLRDGIEGPTMTKDKQAEAIERIALMIGKLLCAVPFGIWQDSWLAGLSAYWAVAVISYRGER